MPWINFIRDGSNNISQQITSELQPFKQLLKKVIQGKWDLVYMHYIKNSPSLLLDGAGMLNSKVGVSTDPKAHMQKMEGVKYILTNKTIENGGLL